MSGPGRAWPLCSGVDSLVSGLRHRDLFSGAWTMSEMIASTVVLDLVIVRRFRWT